MTGVTRKAVDHAGPTTSNQLRSLPGQMPSVAIYTTPRCAFCLRAKDYLRSQGVPDEEVDVTGDDEARERLVERANGQRTIPQIFVGEVHVGGYTDLVRLDREGRFRPLLAGEAFPDGSGG